MKLSWFGRLALALFASLALGLGMSACGGGTIAYLWVTGLVSGGTDGQVAAFKVDDFTGNLTQAPHQPFAAQGANPVMILVKTGGRFVYVLNQGTEPALTTTGTNTCTTDAADCHLRWTGSGISVFSVGGDGSLTYLQHYDSQGVDPQWIQFDSTNGFLYVLDKYGPAYQSDPTKAGYDVNGSISVFSIDPTTGRLFAVPNNQSTPPLSGSPYYWEVGQSPFMMKSASNCLFTVNSADHSITPYSQGSSGQLVNVTTGKIATNAATISSINGNGSTIILTDSANNNIIPYSVGGACALNIFTGGIVANAAGTQNPVNSLISNDNKYLYILNHSTTNTQPNSTGSSITGFLIQNGQLSPLTQYGSPWPVGSGPSCMVEDPTNLYMYTSDFYSGEVSGKKYDDTTGALQQLPRGSDFSATGNATCLAISGAVD